MHYVGGAGEYSRLEAAIALEREPALRSASWGMFQIMGFNHQKAGYASVQAFVDAMRTDEAEQLMAFIRFILGEGLGGYLKAKEWKQFAEKYNGPDYVENRYDVLLAQAYEAYDAS